MRLPDLSHLQMLVIEALGPRRLSGRELRDALHRLRVNKSAPAFYQLMSRLEEAKFVEGEYEQKTIDGVGIKERFYRLTGQGSKAYREAIKFYSERSMEGLTTA